MGTVSTDPVTIAAPAITNAVKRDVREQLVTLEPRASVLMSLVVSGAMKGDIKSAKNLISKRSVMSKKYESFTYDPLAVTFTSGGLSSTTLTLDSSTGLTAGMTLFNTSDFTTARVDSVTSSTEVEITEYGSTFTADNDIVLLVMATAYGSGSSDPAIISKSEDQVYNVLQTIRHAWEITDEEAATGSYLGDNRARLKKKSIIDGLRKFENTLQFSNRPTTGITSTGGTALSTVFSSTRGLFQMAGNVYNAGGSLTHKKFKNDLIRGMGDTVDDGKKYVMFCGRNLYGRMLEWLETKNVLQTKQGEYDKFGVKSTTFVTMGPDIEVITHDSYGRGSLDNTALIFKPEDLTYVYLKGRDIRINKNLQSNSSFTKKDELTGDIGLQEVSGGNSVTRIINAF